MKNRVIWKMFVLEIVTLGIYRLYWLIKTRREMMNVDNGIKILSPILLLIPVIFIIFSFGAFFMTSFQSEANLPDYCKTLEAQNQSRPTYPDDCLSSPATWSILVLLLSIFIVTPLVIVWLWSYSKGVEKITKEKMGFPLALLILSAVPDGIDILLVQDAFNKVTESTAKA